MARCNSCNGILAKSERACYVCGERAPQDGRAKSPGFSALGVLGLLALVGIVLYSGFRL